MCLFILAAATAGLSDLLGERPDAGFLAHSIREAPAPL